MSDDLSTLNASEHWLGWLGNDPAQAVRDEVERILQQQEPTARLDWIRLLDKPHYLTGGRKQPDDPGTLIVTRAGLAVPFELQVQSSGEADQLCGVFSWVASGFDAERRDRVYIDLDSEFTAVSEELTVRLYELDSSSDAAP